jgi:transcriptional regulator of acetoin/glycerol metabolism
MTGLLHYDWPYNVRELEACIKRAVALSDGGMLGPELLPDSIQEAMTDYGRGGSIPPRSDSGIMPPTTPLSAEVLIPSETELRGLLAAYKGNVAAVGRELGKARMQVHRWMKRYGISVDDYRE